MRRLSQVAVPRPGLVAALVAAGLGVAALLGIPRPGLAQDPVARTDADPVVVYLVRHAEKAPESEAEDPRDPPLGEAGRRRAGSLARLLEPAGVTAIYSTELERTRRTAAPLARALGLPVRPYDPRALDALAERLRRRPGRSLVVGHSNTTPALVALLGGDPGEPIDEPTEFDRLYILVLRGDGPVTTVRLRY